MNVTTPLARIGALLLIQLIALPSAFADPCGMVPPFPLTQGKPELRRVGDQITYAFFSNGIEDLVLRPGFEGEVSDFGMLIPFPSAPEIRKVPDEIFAHIAAAVEPPEVVIDMRERLRRAGRKSVAKELLLDRDELELGFVNVLREEAVGMYQVAVLEASDPAALSRWLVAHGYVYPTGMDEVCGEYIAASWCFVAVKADIGSQPASDPKPGMRAIDPVRPTGTTFDGAVQAMGFRFRVEEPVIPMRLSAFNEGELHNRVYILSDTPCRIAELSPELVERQIPGARLRRNLTAPRPLKVLGGTEETARRAGYLDLPQYDRDPAAVNGFARDLFASDLMAVRENRLLHEFETREKELLKIGERLGLRGAEVDVKIRKVLTAQQRATEGEILAALDRMTLTVIEGDFPRAVLAAQNLSFVPFGEPAAVGGVETGAIDLAPKSSAPPSGSAMLLAGLLLACGLGVGLRRGGRGGFGRGGFGGGSFGAAILGLLLLPGLVTADFPAFRNDAVLKLIERLADPATSEEAAARLVALGAVAIPDLIGEAREGQDLSRRGWSVVCLSEIGHPSAVDSLTKLREDEAAPELLVMWAGAALTRIRGAEEIRERLLAAQNDPNALPELVDLLVGLRGAAVLPLIEIGLTAPDIVVRQQAMSLLGSLDQRLRGGTVRISLEAALRYSSRAETLPWEGGPLFLPGYAWKPDEAQRVSLDLCSWLVAAERRGDTAAAGPLLNNLRDLSWRTGTGFQQHARAYEWLRAFLNAAGLDGSAIHEETDSETLILIAELLRERK